MEGDIDNDAEVDFDHVNDDIIDDVDYQEETDDEENEDTDKTKKMNVITDEVTAALDSARISNYHAAVILAAVAKVFGVNIQDTNISVNTIRRRRALNRSRKAELFRENLKVDEIVCGHWDGKIVDSLNGNGNVDRQALIITGKNTNQLLGAPLLMQGTGMAIAEIFVSYLEKWNCVENVRALCFDTTAVNSGMLAPCDY